MGKVYEISEYIETFCACAFISYILLVGGFNDGFLDSCMKYGMKENKWKDVSKMNEAICSMYSFPRESCSHR